MLKNKHSTICFKARFDSYPYLYTAAFDYKLVQWNLEDPVAKSHSRNIFEILSKNIGAESLAYNPPFIYCMSPFTHTNGSRQIVVGLGNGMLLRFKKKSLQLEEICGDVGHRD